ncbi:hypothetical protein K7432_011120 [Basidiobolus ranarum]|uniref:Uncharacterized protein n=1 Tax=Basidiobolus ranarum TaxID=34480 RepID=A0ABR2WMS5_9FUNG
MYSPGVSIYPVPEARQVIVCTSEILPETQNCLTHTWMITCPPLLNAAEKSMWSFLNIQGEEKL